MTRYKLEIELNEIEVAELQEIAETSSPLMAEVVSKIRKLRNNPLCPYESHADDCDCRGMGGDR